MNSSEKLPLNTNGKVIASTASDLTSPRSLSKDRENLGRYNTLVALLEVPFMYKWLVLGCLCFGTAVGVLALVFWPKQYQSEARLLVKVGRANVSLDPTATTGAALMSLQKTQQEEIATALEVLKSREIAEQVVSALGQDVVLSGQLPGADPSVSEQASRSAIAEMVVDGKKVVSGWVNGLAMQMGMKEALGPHELAVRRVHGSVTSHSPRGSAVIVITGKAGNPEMAQRLVREVSSGFMEEHLKGTHTKGSFDFFSRQVRLAENGLEHVVSNRAEFMTKQDVVSIPSSRELLQSEMAGVTRDLAVADGQYQQTVAEIRDLKTRLAATDNEVISEKLQASDNTWSGMRQQFYELELEEQRLSATLAPEHPRLKRIRSLLQGARGILDDFDSERIDQSTTINPIKLQLVESLNEKETLAVGLQSMVTAYENQRAKLIVDGASLLEKERRLNKMDRDVAMITGTLLSMQAKLEEARVKQELYSSKFSNAHVFQKATLVERPVSPDKKILGAGFVVLGLAVGLFLAFVKAGANSLFYLRTPHDVEKHLGVPVIAKVPRMKSKRRGGNTQDTNYHRVCADLMAELCVSEHLNDDRCGRSIGVIGVEVDAGASTLAIQLAHTSAKDCKLRTVLVDADSRRRSISKAFGLNGAPGLVELLEGASPDECLQKEGEAGLELISSAAESCTQTISCSASTVDQALQTYLRDCDLLIVDLPAASQPDRTVALTQYLDYVVVVVESERTRSDAAKRFVNRISASRAEVIGVALTKSRHYLPKLIRSFVPVS